MSIVVSCDSCGGAFKAPDEAAGKSATCPKCGAAIDIRQPEEISDEELDQLFGLGGQADLAADSRYSLAARTASKRSSATGHSHSEARPLPEPLPKIITDAPKSAGSTRRWDEAQPLVKWFVRGLLIGGIFGGIVGLFLGDPRIGIYLLTKWGIAGSALGATYGFRLKKPVHWTGNAALIGVASGFMVGLTSFPNIQLAPIFVFVILSVCLATGVRLFQGELSVLVILRLMAAATIIWVLAIIFITVTSYLATQSEIWFMYSGGSTDWVVTRSGETLLASAYEGGSLAGAVVLGLVLPTLFYVPTMVVLFVFWFIERETAKQKKDELGDSNTIK